MRIVLAKQISPNNINLAYVKGEKIRSDDVIQYKDLSGEVDENQLPIFAEARLTTSTNTVTPGITKLNLLVDTLNPKITSEFNFIKETAEYYPLWNKYTTKSPYFNTTAQKKLFLISACEIGKEYEILSTRAKVLVCPNTFTIWEQNTSNYLSIPGDAIYNNGTRTLTVTASGLSGKDIAIEFYVINNTISVRDELGNEISTKYIRIEPIKYETTPSETNRFGEVGVYGISDLTNLYDITVLFDNVLNPDLTYFIEYLAYDVNAEQTENRIEVLNIEPIYQKVSEFEAFHTFDSKVFKLVLLNPYDETYEIHTMIPNVWPRIYVDYPTNRNTKLTIVEPDNVPHDQPWFIEVSLDRTIVDNYTYSVLEKTTQGIINDLYQITSTIEDVVKLDNHTIKTQYNNLYIIFDNTGKPTNIKIENDGQDISDLIEWVDGKRGLIKLKSSINFVQKASFITYKYFLYNVQYKHINVNPYMVYNLTNNSILDKFVVLYMLPHEELDATKGRSIFHTIVYKSPERYDNVQEYEVSIEEALKFIRGESYLEHKFVYDQCSEYINSSVIRGDELHPLILGYISSSNITTPENLKFIDIRRRGGGIPLQIDFNELYAGSERHYNDIALYDGYNYDLSNIAIIEIKKSVRDMFVEILSKHDPYAQRQLRDGVSQFNIIEYANSFINQKIAKYLNAAARFIVEYKD